MFHIVLQPSQFDDLFEHNSAVLRAYEWCEERKEEGMKCFWRGITFSFQHQEDAVEFRLAIG